MSVNSQALSTVLVRKFVLPSCLHKNHWDMYVKSCLRVALSTIISALQVKRGNRDNFGIICRIYAQKFVVTAH